MKTSIAMTTYNGMDYLEELLDSIRAQIRNPDEVVIVDDCSTDGTPDFIADYIERYGLSGWNIYKNEENLGWRKNFRLALKKCSNDLIFLCDQDDIWKQTKIKDMSAIMENNPHIELLASDYERLNMDSNEDVGIHNGFFKNSNIVTHKAFNYGSLNVLRPGCTYCIRSSLIKCLEKEDIITSPHDAVLWGYAAVRSSLYHFRNDSIIYRRHLKCASLSNDDLDVNKRIRQIEYDISMEVFFNKIADDNNFLEESEIIRKKILFSKSRLRTIKKDNVLIMAFFVIMHIKYYPTIRNGFSDIYICLKKRKKH